MKIAVFTDVFLPYISGVVTSTLNLVEALEKQGHEVEIFRPAPQDQKNKVKKVGQNIKVNNFTSIKSSVYPSLKLAVPYSLKAEKIFKEKDFDLIHAMTPAFMGFAAVFFAHNFKLPLVKSFHTFLAHDSYLKHLHINNIPGAEKIAWAYINYVNKKADVVVCPSNFAAKKLRKTGIKSDIKKISNSLSLEKFNNQKSFSETKKDYPFLEKNTFVYFGRVSTEKSILFLVKSFHKIINQHPEINLLIIGDGPDLKKVKKYIQKNNLQDNIKAVGRIKHEELLKSGLLHNSLAFITASQTENQPMTILESIACDLPCLVADARGNPELINGNGFTFKPNDYQDLSQKVIRFYQNPQLQKKFRQKSSQIKGQYDRNKIVHDWVKLYKKTIEKHDRPPSFWQKIKNYFSKK